MCRQIGHLPPSLVSMGMSTFSGPLSGGLGPVLASGVGRLLWSGPFLLVCCYVFILAEHCRVGIEMRLAIAS